MRTLYAPHEPQSATTFPFLKEEAQRSENTKRIQWETYKESSVAQSTFRNGVMAGSGACGGR